MNSHQLELVNNKMKFFFIVVIWLVENFIFASPFSNYFLSSLKSRDQNVKKKKKNFGIKMLKF